MIEIGSPAWYGLLLLVGIATGLAVAIARTIRKR